MKYKVSGSYPAHVIPAPVTCKASRPKMSEARPPPRGERPRRLPPLQSLP